MQWRYDNQILHSEKSIYSPATGVHKTGADEADNGSSTTADKISPTTASSFYHEQVKQNYCLCDIFTEKNLQDLCGMHQL